MWNKIKGLVVEEKGQGMTEYGLVLGLIAIAVVGSLALLREEIIGIFKNVVEVVQKREEVPTP
jgi:pilus assembly protein Flp/PilA